MRRRNAPSNGASAISATAHGSPGFLYPLRNKASTHGGRSSTYATTGTRIERRASRRRRATSLGTMNTGVRVAITAGTVLAVGLLWRAFDSAPPGSRRANFDRRVRQHGERQVDRRWRRPSFIAFAVTQVLLLLALIWIALR